MTRCLPQDEQRAYEKACASFKSEKARASLNVDTNGSNLWKVLLLNQIGIKTATLGELEALAVSHPEFLQGHFEDAPSVCLRSAEDSYAKNDYLTKQLAEYIGKSKIKTPVVISGLKIKKDDASDYGLSFEKDGDFTFFEAQELSHVNNIKKFSRGNEKGIPIFDKNGTRKIYTRDKGLSRLYLDWNLDLCSLDGGLTNSYFDGRMVVDYAEGVAPEMPIEDETNGNPISGRDLTQRAIAVNVPAQIQNVRNQPKQKDYLEQITSGAGKLEMDDNPNPSTDVKRQYSQIKKNKLEMD
jgi:hypothetical protein